MAEPVSLRGCPGCGLVHRVPALPARHAARCVRCGARIASSRGPRPNERAAAAALAALLLYPLAISLPILRLERFGRASAASIWEGSVGLIADGEWLVGAAVFLCSIVVPLLKLLTVLLLCCSPRRLGRVQRARAWRAVELAGRFGMLDVLLVAVLVAWLKLGDLVEVRAGPAAVAFTACVLCSLLASAWFDAHALWEEAAA